MKVTALLSLAAAIPLARAHATVMAIFVNDVDQGLGNGADGYIRSPANNSPVVDVTSSDMTCNVNNSPVPKTIQVKAGDVDDIIDPSHVGPVMTYIAPTSSNGEGDVWVKLAEDGFDSEWAVERLRANGGKHSITVPDIEAGEYLLRPEIIALHEAFFEGGAQLYMECVQIEITTSGSVALPEGVAIPGAYFATDPGIFFDLYNGFSSYPIPGPDVWDGTGDAHSSAEPSSAEPSSAEPSAEHSSTPSLKPTLKPPPEPEPASSSPSTPATTTVIASSSPATLIVAPTPSLTTMVTITRAECTDTAAAPSGTSAGGVVAKYYQCGGRDYNGPTQCEAGTTCKEWNEWYFQCV
ncbi:glycosyl hydrolase family 61-domain-containing protein [Lineolata rhizophorae]|uniref:AA9 family lytic polysaccharide monooxygenase n=1 Tax=Lineolata rhizophorae TaxID=578093 RepID=A0A6A6P0Q5_9PEZI|nr:glycosyl hydrolase family 61-domain-containing protein [Lineolata rhizophorae]